MVPIDIVSFIDSGVQKYLNDGYIAGGILEFLRLHMIDLVEERGGYAVFGGGEQIYELSPSPEPATAHDIYLAFNQGRVVAYEMCRRKGISHQPHFYFSSSELCLSFMRIPLIAYGLDHPEVFRHKRNKFLLSRLVYQSEWPTIVTRPKYDGLEGIRDKRKEFYTRMREEFGDALQEYRLSIPIFKQQLSGRF